MAESMFELLQSVLPMRQRPGRDAFPTSVKAVRQWIDALPLANSGATARLLYNGLKELNHLEVDPAQRMEILELLRQPVAVVITSMERHVLGQPLPLPLQKRQIGAVMRDFHRELALGYATCAVDICAPKGSIPFLRGKSVAMALTRGLTHLSLMLSKCYLAYSEIPTGTWSLAHRLFAFAHEQSLLDKPHTDSQLPGATLTPESMYVQMLLCFIGNPYRLTQKDIVDVEAAARVWASSCRLDTTGTTGSFLIDVRSDTPPMSPRADLPVHWWRLDCSGLVAQLRGLMQAHDSREMKIPVRGRLGQAGELSHEVVERLIVAWSFSGERGHPRLPADHQMDAAVGLHAVHHLTAGGVDFSSFLRDISGNVSLTDRERSAAWAHGTSDAAQPTVMPVRVLDQSLGGYRLLWERAEGLKARVGELIAIAAPSEGDESRDWMLGVLRWLKGGSTDGLEAGVQLLSRRVEPVALRSSGESTSAKVILRGLLLSPLTIDGSRSPSLLAPSILDASGGVELLRLPDPMGIEERPLAEDLIELHLLENTGSYKQFAFGEQRAADTRLSAPEAPPPSELDEIWSTV